MYDSFAIYRCNEESICVQNYTFSDVLLQLCLYNHSFKVCLIDWVYVQGSWCTCRSDSVLVDGGDTHVKEASMYVYWCLYHVKLSTWITNVFLFIFCNYQKVCRMNKMVAVEHIAKLLLKFMFDTWRENSNSLFLLCAEHLHCLSSTFKKLASWIQD